MRNFLTGHSFSALVGAGSGGGVTWSPGNGAAIQGGFFTPQAGVGYSYGFRIGNLQDLPPNWRPPAVPDCTER